MITVSYMLSAGDPPTVNLSIDGIVLHHADTDDLGEIIDACLSAIAEVEAFPTPADVAEGQLKARDYDAWSQL